MLVEKGYRFRIYPTPAQVVQINKTFGCCRYVYNHILGLEQQAYREEKKYISKGKVIPLIPELKRELPWLIEVDSITLQSAVEDMDSGYQRFFDYIRKVKSGEAKLKQNKKKGKKNSLPFEVNPPHFKSKKEHKQSYRTKNVNNSIRLGKNKLRLPKLGLVKIRLSRRLEGRITSVTVTRTSSGKYFASIHCKDVPVTPLPKAGKVVGVDLGVKDLAVLSTGEKFSNPHFYIKSQKRLALEQRRLSRKPMGSRNYEKQRLKVARLQEHVSNQRKDMLHKLTTELVRSYDVISIEDLAPENMVKNHHLAKHIEDSAFGELRRQLTYKTEWYGKTLVEVGRFYPSSQLCNTCDFQNKEVKDLSVRIWECPNCHTLHDRDVNAACNILKEGLRLLEEEKEVIQAA